MTVGSDSRLGRFECDRFLPPHPDHCVPRCEVRCELHGGQEADEGVGARKSRFKEGRRDEGGVIVLHASLVSFLRVICQSDRDTEHTIFDNEHEQREVHMRGVLQSRRVQSIQSPSHLILPYRHISQICDRGSSVA